MKNKKALLFLVILVAVGVLGLVLMKTIFSNKVENEEPTPVIIENTGDFTIDLLKRVNKEDNYLISPYSIEVALNMLRVGAVNKTKEEIDNVLPQRDLTVSNKNVKISNALFIKDIYKNVIEKPFENELKSKYNSTVLYDEFKTPKVINNWVKESTDGMIEKILDDIVPDFVLGLANAIAIDVNWYNKFECSNTTGKNFTMADGKNMTVEMMRNSYRSNVKYLDEENIKGVVLPYEENLEFIALLPNEKLNVYVNNLTKESLNDTLLKFKDILSTERLNLSLPRFSYRFSIDNFIEILTDMGITSAFDPIEADFSKIITKENLNKLNKDNIYVSDAIHKTYIDLNENGTKAAAVTYFGIKTASAIEQLDVIEIEFNKPFIYMIRDTETKEILFIGGVYKPNKWNGNTCSNKD